jgi:hypothetical protein
MPDRRIAALAAAALLISPRTALAWGNEGHEVVALIAYDHMTPQARKEAMDLLAADTNAMGVGPDFASFATWADVYKYSDDHRGPYIHTGDWHFANIELADKDVTKACSGLKLYPGTAVSQGPDKVCVVDKINDFAAELHDKAAPQAERILALKYLLHLVGDLHQPLHSADNHDSGGNCQSVHTTDGATKKLHAFWDDDTVSGIDPDPSKAAAILEADITPGEIASWSAGAPSDWAMEAKAVAIATAYTTALKKPCSKRSPVSVTLDAKYESDAVQAAKLQLGRAGVRLAKVLNGALQ